MAGEHTPNTVVNAGVGDVLRLNEAGVKIATVTVPVYYEPGEMASGVNIPSTERILGIAFFNRSCSEAVQQVARTGGLVVAPAAPSMVELRYDEEYRRALLAADLAIADSGFMAMLWKFQSSHGVTRISGLKYLKCLLEHETIRRSGAAVWVVPSPDARERALKFLQRVKFPTGIEDFHVAPQYRKPVEDETLLTYIRQRRPAHIVIAVGGGAQDKLGRYLKENLEYRPAIHCIGAALGFLTGDQIAIPDWADRFYFGWFLRLLAQPHIFIPRLWRARQLPWMIIRYGREMPPLVRF